MVTANNAEIVLKNTELLNKFMKSKLLLIIAGIVGTTAAVHAQITSYDGFDYTASANLAGQTNWTAANSGTAPVIASGSLSVSGMPASTGNSVSFPGGNFQEALGALNTFTSGTVYFSIALNLTSQPTAAAYSFALATGGTNYGAVVWIQASGAGYNLGLSNRSSGSTVGYDTTVLALNTTVFIVGSYTFNSGTGDDASALWINPDSSTFGSTAPSVTLSAIGGTDLSQINQFLLRGAAGSPAGSFDEFRIGTSWASVTSAVPEPSSYAAILGGLVLTAVVAQRRRQSIPKRG